MRRSDLSPPVPRRWNTLLQRPPLPLPVYRDLVDSLFAMRLPILGLGVVVAALAGLAAWQWRDPVFLAIALATLVVTAGRCMVLHAFSRARPTEEAGLSGWERRYAIGAYAFALLLAALNLHAFTYHLPLLHMLTVSLVFAFGAGVVSRISVRPVICVVSLLLATVPTALGLLAHTLTPHDAPLHTQIFAIEGLIVVMITGLSLQTVAHLYRSAVAHLTIQHDLATIAKHDELTGLANRLLLRERFQDAGQAAIRANSRLALHFIDLDGFKPVNDGYGHPAGDVVLKEVARRIQATLRAEDTVARLGGDEFVILQVDVAHDSEAELLARRIIRTVSAPYEIEDGVSVRISASVGVATTPEVALELERLLACADAALYRSKLGGKARVTFCTSEDIESAQLAA